MTEVQAESLWTYWGEGYRKHALEAVGYSSPKVPFSCESRLKIDEHKSTFSKIRKQDLTLILRKDSKPNEGSQTDTSAENNHRH